MARRELSREELFALVWEKPTREIARDLGLSDVAIGKLCARLQVPKPPRGYRERLVALLEAERIHEMMSHAAYAMERDVPGEMLALADRIFFGDKRPFQAAREAWRHLEDELERWETELEAERSALARSILEIGPGDIVTSQSRGRLLRLSVTETSLYASDRNITFVIQGIRFRKDGTLGKLQETLTLSFEEE